jgi:large subunit ribosomal protein L33
VSGWIAGRAAQASAQPFNEVLMAKKKSQGRQVITLECTEQKETGIPGMSRYTTQKNKKNTTGRIELMKYNRFLRRHTLHREIK